MKGYSSFSFYYPIYLSSKYCSFAHNIVTTFRTVEYWGSSGLVSYSNFIHNNSPTNFGVLYLSGSGSYVHKFCVFRENQNTLCFANSGALRISHSYLSHQGTLKSGTGSLLTPTNVSFVTMNTIPIVFFKTFLFHADLEMPYITVDLKTFLDLYFRFHSPNQHRKSSHYHSSTIQNTIYSIFFLLSDLFLHIQL